jgi:hypothetical protein
MLIMEVDFECVMSEFPDCVSGFLDSLEFTPGKSIDVDFKKIKFYYHFGFFSSKKKTHDDFKYRLSYDDRLKFELSRVDIEMVVGKFSIKDRFDNTSKLVTRISSDIVKSMIYEEQLILKDEYVLSSISDYIKLREELELKGNEDTNELYLDDVLDKISASGMDSLSVRELDFLRKSSE